jgi:phosphoribosylformimino-5-aminoimidazole carboxamide ribotide isomerase
MRVLGVVDLLDGSAVHARAGDRERYRAVTSTMGSPIAPGDAIELARAYSSHLNITELYVADLDAIGGRARQQHVISGLVALGLPVWLDAGTRTIDDARQAIDLGVANVIVGLETLASFDALAAICADTGGHRVAFSLDLRDGTPITACTPFTGSALTRQNGDVSNGEPPEIVAARAAAAGVSSVIVLDLARVGTRASFDFALIERVRRAVPGTMLLAGGGVRGPQDLERLANAGCDGVLVATALHDGGIGADVVRAAHGYVSRRR